MQCDKCESGNFENIQLSFLESGSWHLTLWQTCLIGRAKLALHSISRHLKHFLLLFSPEVLRKRFYLQYQEAVYVKPQQNMSGRLENSGSSEPVIVALYYFQLWLWSGNLKRVLFLFFFFVLELEILLQPPCLSVQGLKLYTAILSSKYFFINPLITTAKWWLSYMLYIYSKYTITLVSNVQEYSFRDKKIYDKAVTLFKCGI